MKTVITEPLMRSNKNEDFREVSYDEAIDIAAKILAGSRRPLLYGSDVIVFWGCNPVQAHPRHMSRYSSFARGFFTEKGRKGRRIIAVDVRKTHTSGVADEYVEVQQGSDYLVISALRAILLGHADVVPDQVGNVTKEQLIKIIDTLKSAKFGVLFFGMGLTQSESRYKNIDNEEVLNKIIMRLKEMNRD